jgi:hypothetical protein
MRTLIIALVALAGCEIPLDVTTTDNFAARPALPPPPPPPGCWIPCDNPEDSVPALCPCPEE